MIASWRVSLTCGHWPLNFPNYNTAKSAGDELLAAFKRLDPLNVHFLLHMRSNQWFDKLVPFNVDFVVEGGRNHHHFDFGCGRTMCTNGGVSSVPQPHPGESHTATGGFSQTWVATCSLGGWVCVAEIINFRLTMRGEDGGMVVWLGQAHVRSMVVTWPPDKSSFQCGIMTWDFYPRRA
jgi:hypothetical protein